MPIWDAPPRRLVTLIQRLARDRREHAPGQDDVSRERVQAVLAGDAALVRDRVVPISGQAQLRAGQEVHVWNRAGQPDVVLAHTARRAHFPAAPPVVAGQIVEELFLAGSRSSGVFDVYFRNFDQVTALGLTTYVSATTPPNSLPTSLLGWGEGTDRFFLQSGGTIRVFKLNRAANVAYQPGVKAKAALEREYTLASFTGQAATWDTLEGFIGFAITALTWSITLGGALAVPVGATGSAAVSKVLVDERGHVVVDYAVSGTSGAVFRRDVIVDLTDQAVLFKPPATLDLRATYPLVTSTVMPRTMRMDLAKVRAGAIDQCVVFRNPQGQGGQVFWNYLVEAAVNGPPQEPDFGAPVGTTTTTLVLLDEAPTVSGFDLSNAHDVMAQLNDRHLLWALTSGTGTDPFANAAQVFLRSLPQVGPPPVEAGPATQVGTTLGKFFFDAGADAYGNPLMLLRPFDMLWATVTVDASTSPESITAELLYPVAAWKPADPAAITLQEADPKFPARDAPLVAVAGMRALPEGVVIVGGTLTPAAEVFQAVNDGEVLASVGRRSS